MANEESHASSVIAFLSSPEREIYENIVETTEYSQFGPWMPIIDWVPDVLRKQNENAYSPIITSIGPLHEGRRRLQEMKPVKLSYMSTLFKRTGEPEETKRNCVTAMFKLEGPARAFYEQGRLLRYTGNVSSLMIIDGCFIIELLYRNYNYDYDPILWNPFKFYAIQRDLLLVENQIPFFVLQELFNLTVAKIPHQRCEQLSLREWVFSFFGNMMGVEDSSGSARMENISSNPCHIIHLFHMYYLRFLPKNLSYIRYDQERTGIKYSATQLRLAGVKLKAGHKRHLFDIRFTTTTFFRKHQLEIPPFSVSEFTESFLLNLIAFEITNPEIDSYFTSLAFLMDILIETPEDVKLFEEAGIIRNYLGSREEVARLFNGIFKKAIPRRFHYHEQYKQAIHFHKPRRVSTGRLRHHYFGNPWSRISVFAGIILFSLTFLSTLYTMLSYYN